MRRSLWGAGKKRKVRRHSKRGVLLLVKKGRIRKRGKISKRGKNGNRRANRGSRGRSYGRKSAKSSRARTARSVVKKPLVLASVEPMGHSMHKNSGLLIYWLTLLALVILNMLTVMAIAILQLAMGTKQFFFVVAALGLFFGYLTYRLVTLVENLGARHHFFAWLLVPAAAMLNLFIISSAASTLSSAIGFGYKYNPLLVSASYMVAFLIPAAVILANRLFVPGKKVKKGGLRR